MVCNQYFQWLEGWGISKHEVTELIFLVMLFNTITKERFVGNFRLWTDNPSHNVVLGSIPATELVEWTANNPDNNHGNNKQLTAWLCHEHFVWLSPSSFAGWEIVIRVVKSLRYHCVPFPFNAAFVVIVGFCTDTLWVAVILSHCDHIKSNLITRVSTLNTVFTVCVILNGELWMPVNVPNSMFWI